MGFLHKLWDETLAGPTPDSGLGKLRKYNSFSGPRSAAAPPPGIMMDHDIPVSRSITILRSNSTSTNSAARNFNAPADSGSGPSSPAASTTPSTPTSPFSPSAPGGNIKKLTRRKSTSAALQQTTEEARSPTGYDWIVLSALDR